MIYIQALFSSFRHSLTYFYIFLLSLYYYSYYLLTTTDYSSCCIYCFVTSFCFRLMHWAGVLLRNSGTVQRVELATGVACLHAYN